MRVIGGMHRSRILKEVDSIKTRATRDRVKESIFNSLSQDMIEASVLDLFAGSGSLGIEALSRGASTVQFVDSNPKPIKVIRANIQMLDLEQNATITQGDAMSFLETTKDTFDVIILDPPYDMHILEMCIQKIQERKVLNTHGVIACLFEKNYTLKLDNFDIISYKHKKIGITNVSYLKWGI